MTMQTEQCKIAHGSSFIQFGLFDISEISDVGTLTIDSCEFKHFFFDFNSFIGLNNGHGHVVITNSNFEKFSNCGSIIRDSKHYPEVTFESDDNQNIINSARDTQFSVYITKDRMLGEASTS